MDASAIVTTIALTNIAIITGIPLIYYLFYELDGLKQRQQNQETQQTRQTVIF
ncbi:MAG: hypothetical protein HQM14_20580 [SAR324 cluster bacterium]|nr:hypothetical protein [SAR324 cluster bacterium]